ncbi:MAG: hypothetical protein AB8B96_03020 [Lysobacterales bacterium]
MAGAFAALLLGSAFASGQEALQFYASHGFLGIAGIGVSLLLFTYVAYSLFNAGREKHLTTTEDIFLYYCGRYAGTLLAWYAIVFITLIYWIMLVGAGAALQQGFGVPEWAGRILMALASLATILLGLRRIVEVIGLVGPLLIVVTLGISVASLLASSTNLVANAEGIAQFELLKAAPSWFTSSILYVGLSLMGLASFLPAVGQQMTSNRQVLSASILGPVLLMAAMLFVTLALINQISQMVGAAMPTMVLAEALSPGLSQVFAAVIVLGIYTTACPLMWVVCARFSSEKDAPYKSKVYQGVAVSLALIGVLGGGVLPFAKMVNLIYPTVGYAGFAMLIFMLFTDLRKTLSKSS